MMVFLIVYSIGISFALVMLGYVCVRQLHREICKRFDNEPSFSERVEMAEMANAQMARHKIAMSPLGVVCALAGLHALKWPEGKPRHTEVYEKEGSKSWEDAQSTI